MKNKKKSARILFWKATKRAALGGEASRTLERWVADLPPGLHVGWLRCHPEWSSVARSQDEGHFQPKKGPWGNNNQLEHFLLKIF